MTGEFFSRLYKLKHDIVSVVSDALKHMDNLTYHPVNNISNNIGFYPMEIKYNNGSPLLLDKNGVNHPLLTLSIEAMVDIADHFSRINESVVMGELPLFENFTGDNHQFEFGSMTHPDVINFLDSDLSVVTNSGDESILGEIVALDHDPMHTSTDHDLYYVNNLIFVHSRNDGKYYVESTELNSIKDLSGWQ